MEIYRYLMDDFLISFCRKLDTEDFALRDDSIGGKKGKRVFLNKERNKELLHRFEDYFQSHVSIPRVNVGKKQKLAPEEILAYIYAVLYSSTFRDRYRQFLKIDFPRIPFVKEYSTFRIISELGRELMNLHLMKAKLPSSIRFDVQGSNVVEFVKYKDGKVYINKEQFFEGISEASWNYCTGGYQVLDKWLKSRKKRQLSGVEIEQFIQIVGIINETIGCMKKIDAVGFLE